MIRYISAQILKFFGWQLDRRLPAEKKYLIIGAPHTSNWDFPLAILALSAMGMHFSWVGTHTLFHFPFGYLFRALGGIPVNRHIRQSFIAKMIELFSSSEELVMAIAPEGTRAKTSHWKTGFYAIAVEAAVPVALGYLDYQNNKIGVWATLYPSGSIEDDFHIIRSFYAGKTGKFTELQGPLELRRKEIHRSRAKRADLQAMDTQSPKCEKNEAQP